MPVRLPVIGFGLFGIVLIGLASGCGGGTPAVNTTPASQPTATAAMPIELVQVSASGFDAVLAEAKGKPVLVDFWFLGCAPCKKAFPHIVELHEKYKNQGLVVMSYSIMPEDWESKDKVLQFMTEKQAHFQHLVAKSQIDSDAVTEKYKIGSTPAQLILDRSGKVIEVPEDTTHEQLEKMIQQSL